MNRLQLFLCKVFKQHRYPMTEWELKNIARHPARFYIKVNLDGVQWIREGSDTPVERSAGKSLMYSMAFEVIEFDRAIQRKLKKLKRSVFSPPLKKRGFDDLIEETKNEESRIEDQE